MASSLGISFGACAKRHRFCGVGKDSSGANIFHGGGVEKTRRNLVKCFFEIGNSTKFKFLGKSNQIL